MDRQTTQFLFTMMQEFKRFLGSPVILMTMKDYADGVMDALMDLRVELQRGARPQRLSKIVTRFHLDWLRAVDDIDALKRRIRETPRDVVNKAIDFTIDCTEKRNKDFITYINNLTCIMTENENKRMENDFTNITEMHKNLNAALQVKRNCINSIGDVTDYYHKILDEADELLDWLDNLNDNLAVQFSKAIRLKFPTKLTADLTNTLQQFIDEVSASANSEFRYIAKELALKTRSSLRSIIRMDSADDSEIRKILEKISTVENRIEILKNENPDAVMALKHKSLYLEEKLISLENLKMSLFTLKNKRKEKAHIKDSYIFEHLLPAQDRYRLVENLIKQWNEAICNTEVQTSIISILSVADMIEQFSDDYGPYTVDSYGRKHYMDKEIYMDEFMVTNDDEKHIYFYDQWGRYYLDEEKVRIYQEHDNASEYFINDEGLLVKVKETRSQDYWYDNLGRFFVTEYGKKLYTDDGETLYENDGLGNLVRIRNMTTPISLAECPPEPVTMEENKYLQCAVGKALSECIAEVILRQPDDPVLYLALSLKRYRSNQQEQEKRYEDEMELLSEREELMLQQYEAPTAAASLSQYNVEVEGEENDINLITYKTY